MWFRWRRRVWGARGILGGHLGRCPRLHCFAPSGLWVFLRFYISIFFGSISSCQGPFFVLVCWVFWSCLRKVARGIGLAPRLVRWGLGTWQSMKGNCHCWHWAVRMAMAVFDALLAWENMDSPKKHAPRLSPYSPPRSWPSCQHSTEWAYPAWWRSM